MVDDRLSSEVLHLTNVINPIGLSFLVMTRLDKCYYRSCDIRNAVCGGISTLLDDWID